MSEITPEMVMEIHDLILSTESGLDGGHGIGPLEGALGRISSHLQYAEVEDIYEVAALYAVALARGHVFNDANKRTALVTALTYLQIQGVDIPRSDDLEEVMVDVAEGRLDARSLADIFYSLDPDQ